MHKGSWENWGRDFMCSCQLSATLSLSDSSCTDKKENTGTFYGSNDHAMALTVNLPATCCESSISGVQTCVLGQGSQEPDITAIWR